MSPQADDKIKVVPNPAREGGEVEIRGPKGGMVTIVAPGGKVTPVKLDGDGKAKIDAPGKGGEEFSVADEKWPESTELVVPVVSNSK